MAIHHIEGGGAAHRRALGNGDIGAGGARLYTRLRRSGYPPGYRVLCQNC